MILSDLPSRTEAFKSNDKPQQGFAQAGNRYPPSPARGELFGIML